MKTPALVYRVKVSAALTSIGAWALSLLLFTASARAAERQVLRGHMAAAAARLQPLHRLPGTNQLRLAIALPLRNKEALTNLLQRIYDPASPDYHRYLTPEQFTERFGPTEADYQALRNFVESRGLTLAGTHPNRVLLDVSGSVADIESAFHLNLHVYQHPTERRTFHAPDREPSIGLMIPVLYVSGLDDFSVPHPLLKPCSMLPDVSTPKAGSGSGGALMGRDFRNAYAPGVSLTGAGQVLGLLQFDGYSPSDILQYEAMAGLPNVPLESVLVGGFNGMPTGNGGEVEVALDIEMAISMAPGLSKIIVYEAPNPSPWVDLLNAMATDNRAKQLSCSWGGGPPDPAADQIFQQMAAQGQSFFCASGDSDAYTGAISFPSDSPYVTVVGGTTLSTGNSGTWASETVWNWGWDNGSYVGSGGGISPYYSIPSWQRGISMSANRGSATSRNIPDVSMAADNILVVADNGSMMTLGGTSAAAPLWAGFAALVNQQAAANGLGPVGFLNPAIYAIGKGSSYTTCFRDVTTGNNNGFFAVPGYDLCTGWGSPRGKDLIDAISLPLASMQGSYAGLFMDDSKTFNSSGLLLLTLTSKGAYTAQMRYLGKTYNSSGKFAPTGAATVTFLTNGVPAVAAALTLNYANHTVTGTVSGPGWLANLYTEQSAAQSAANYTLLVQGNAQDPGAPVGAGFATIKVSAKGMAMLAGRLADGTAISLSTPAGNGNNSLPIYLPLYGRNGGFFGWIGNNMTSASDISGTLKWTKPATKTGAYRGGFNTEVPAFGSLYDNSIDPTISPVDGLAEFWGGNLSQSFTNRINLGPQNRLINLGAGRMTLKINKANGTFTGSVADPRSGRSMSFQGVMLQKANMGAGYVTGTTANGGASMY